jgi:hypothetical protein
MNKHTLSVEKLGKNIGLTFDSNCLTIQGDVDNRKKGIYKSESVNKKESTDQC